MSQCGPIGSQMGSFWPIWTFVDYSRQNLIFSQKHFDQYAFRVFEAKRQVLSEKVQKGAINGPKIATNFQNMLYLPFWAIWA